jgi:hypothetical protein
MPPLGRLPEPFRRSPAGIRTGVPRDFTESGDGTLYVSRRGADGWVHLVAHDIEVSHAALRRAFLHDDW